MFRMGVKTMCKVICKWAGLITNWDDQVDGSAFIKENLILKKSKESNGIKNAKK